ncbi:MAG: hypothetical protein KKF27_20225 [Gammaproteobacteria bacterium]|nr:hypothetical protein [Gammaproteobacteria bacterium]
MDNYREVELLSRKTVGDSGTETIDINVNEPITELSVRFYVKNATATARSVPVESVVSKIELVDGGRVYASLNGREATAMAWYDKGYWPAAWYSEILSEGSRIEWPFQFGRYLGDPQFAFSPSRMLNPQIKVTWAKNALHLTSVCTLEVNAKVMQGVAPPSKALMTKVIKSWTTLGSGIVEVDLPTDHPYRRLYFRADEAAGYLGNAWTNFKLECDTGSLIVFEMEDDEMMNLMERTWGMAEYQAMVAVSNGVYTYTHLGACHSGYLTAFDGDAVLNGRFTQPGYAILYGINVAGTALTDQKAVLRPRGLCPEYTYCYPFGLQDDPATWFKAPNYGSIKLKITEGAASGLASVFVQQPVSLP